MTDEKPTHHWYRLTPDRCVIGLLVVEGLLLIVGDTIDGMLAVSVVLLGLLFWFIASLCYRWRFQFSIRTLLLLTVAVAIPCSRLGVEVRPWKQQQEAAAAIRKLGGDVVWWAEATPDPFYPKVLAVYWNGPQVTDADLEHLVYLNFPGALDLGRASVTDAGIDILNKLRIHDLVLSDTKVTDAGLERLKLKWLNTLELDGTKVTDAGLEHLTNMNRLEWLILKRTRVTDEGVKKLQQALPKCQIDH